MRGRAKRAAGYPEEQGHAGGCRPSGPYAEPSGEMHISPCSRESREGHPSLYVQPSTCPSSERQKTLLPCFTSVMRFPRHFAFPGRQGQRGDNRGTTGGQQGDNGGEPLGESLSLSKTTCISTAMDQTSGRAELRACLSHKYQGSSSWDIPHLGIS